MVCINILAVSSKALAVLFLPPRKTLEYVEKIRIPENNECGVDYCDATFITTLNLIKSVKDGKCFLKDMETEYTSLFISSYPRTKCPPYESYYIGPDTFLAKEPIIHELNTILNSLGLEVDERKEKMPDHIIVELELLEILLRLPAEDHINSLLDKLVKKHLLVWLPRFSSCIRMHANLDYYKQIAQSLEYLYKCLIRLYGYPLFNSRPNNSL